MYVQPIYINMSRNLLDYAMRYALNVQKKLAPLDTKKGAEDRLQALKKAELLQLPDPVTLAAYKQAVGNQTDGEVVDPQTFSELLNNYDLNYALSDRLIEKRLTDNTFVMTDDRTFREALEDSFREMASYIRGYLSRPGVEQFISAALPRYEGAPTIGTLNLYRYLGVNTGNNQAPLAAFKSYTKLTDTARVNARIDFDVPIMSGQHGEVDFSIFREKMRLLLRDREAPLFAIVDHNSAHHVSYALADFAFASANSKTQNRKRLIINFDNHIDWGEIGQSKIRCNNWARWAVSDQVKQVGDSNIECRVADLYIHFGWSVDTRDGTGARRAKGSEDRSGDFSGTAGYRNSSIKAQFGRGVENGPELLSNLRLPNFSIREQTLAILSDLQQPVAGNRAPEVDVYITVDRDFMLGSFTSYGDGDHTPAHGRSAVLECLHSLQTGALNVRPARLVGFDVVGLPAPMAPARGYKGGRKVEANGNGTAWRNAGTMRDLIERSYQDIGIFYAAVRSYEQPRERPARSLGRASELLAV